MFSNVLKKNKNFRLTVFINLVFLKKMCIISSSKMPFVFNIHAMVAQQNHKYSPHQTKQQMSRRLCRLNYLINMQCIYIVSRPDEPGARPGAQSGCEAPVLYACLFICLFTNLFIYLSFYLSINLFLISLTVPLS